MVNFDEYIRNLKTSIDIVEVIQKDEPLTKRGNSFRGMAHDSLQVTPSNGLWNWHSRNIGGDVFTWLKLIRGWEFKRAVEEMARMYGIDSPDWSQSDYKASAERQRNYDIFDIALNHFVKNLETSKHAFSYCKGRGWTDETITRAKLGYFNGNYEVLRAQFQMHKIDLELPAVVALIGYQGNVKEWGEKHSIEVKDDWIRKGFIPGIPRGEMLVYAHIEFGKVVYFSFRNINEKRHFNLDGRFIGERRPLWNHVATLMDGPVVVVEGQADAITLAQWGIPAVALCGVAIGKTGQGSKLARQLRKHDPVFLATDSDMAGMGAIHKVATVMGPMMRVIQWPDHDANDWLKNQPEQATQDAAIKLLDNAPIYAEILAGQVGQLPDYEKPEGLKRLMRYVIQMDDIEQSVYRGTLAKLSNVSLKIYDRLLKVAVGNTGDEDEDEEVVMIPYPTVGGIVNNHLLEMLYVPPDSQPANAVILSGGHTAFAIRDEQGNINIKEFYDHDGLRFTPIPPDTPFLREGIVLFPSKIGDLCEAKDIIEKIRALINKYVDIDPFYESLSAYYILFTWFFDAFPSTSYLRVKGDAGTGKTRFLEVVGAMCYRPIMMNAGASVPAMFRIMDAIRGTLVLDEGDFSKSDESADIAKLLNVGNQRRQGRISRAGSKETGFSPEFFNVFGPKVISTRKSYDDNAIESRCLTKETGAPTSRDDIPRNLPDTFWTVEIPEIQSMLLRYRFEHWSTELNKREIPIDNSIEPRLQQVTDSLKKMIKDREMLNELQHFVQQYNDQMITKRGLQTEAKLLEALYIIHRREINNNVPEDRRNYSLGDLAQIANDLIDFENDQPIEQWSRFQRHERNKRISSKGAGHLFTQNLNLQTHRPSHDRRRRYHVVFDKKRVFGLWARFGLGQDESDPTRAKLLETYEMIQEAVKRENERLETLRYR